VRVEATDAVVTLTGSTDRRSTAQLAVGLARAIHGVVDVVDRLAYEYDDTDHARQRWAVDGRWGGRRAWSTSYGYGGVA
jgi:hypothetical protein